MEDFFIRCVMEYHGCINLRNCSIQPKPVSHTGITIYSHWPPPPILRLSDQWNVWHACISVMSGKMKHSSVFSYPTLLEFSFPWQRPAIRKMCNRVFVKVPEIFGWSYSSYHIDFSLWLCYISIGSFRHHLSIEGADYSILFSRLLLG